MIDIANIIYAVPDTYKTRPLLSISSVYLSNFSRQEMKVELALIVSIIHLVTCDFNPYQFGSYQVDKKYFSKWELSHNLHIWSPTVKGNFPLVYALTGFAGNTRTWKLPTRIPHPKELVETGLQFHTLTGLVDPSTESIVFSHIASHGFTVVVPHKYLTLATSQYHAEWLVKVDDYVQQNLVSWLRGEGNLTPN